MDELEISGKRYLSTRRAAKDHKYTSDYVGQLIRGGKVVGKKVGRSWYVEEASLNAYLSGESAPVASAVKAVVVEQVVEKKAEEPVAVAAVVVEPEVEKEEEKVVEEKVFEPVIIKTKIVEEHHIPVRTQEEIKAKPAIGLRYVIDEEPALPEIKKKAQPPASPVIPQKVEEVSSEEYVEEEVEVTPRTRVGVFAVAGLVLAGLTTLSLTAFFSAALNSQIVVEEGQVASVGYTFQ